MTEVAYKSVDDADLRGSRENTLAHARLCAASLVAVASSDVRFVRATVMDAEVCFRIARAASIAGFQNVFPSDLKFPNDAIRADWTSAITDPKGETYIAFEDDEAVGVVSVGYGVLQTLYVRPESWSQGVGSALHDLALERLREADVQEARLWTLTENHRARAFYERRGWTLTGGTRVVPFPPHPIDVEYARSTVRS